MRLHKLLVCVGTVVLAALSTDVMGVAMKQSTIKFLSENGGSGDDWLEERFTEVSEDKRPKLLEVAEASLRDEPERWQHIDEDVFDKFDLD